MKKNIVISGASSGLGKELAKKFVSLGWRVIGLARNAATLEKLSEELGENFTFYAVDLQDEAGVLSAFDFIENQCDHIDVIVNNAAVFTMKPFLDCTFKDINSIVDTNLKGVMYSTLKAIEIMKKNNGSGRIINISSVAGVNGIENQAIYCASKFGLNGFAEALNQEIIRHNISISTIIPGGINTPLWNEGNPYPGGDAGGLLQCSDIVKTVEYISGLEPRIILKSLTIFPSNEWH